MTKQSKMRTTHVKCRTVLTVGAGAIILIVCWFALGYGKREVRLLEDGSPCPATLEQSREQNIEKVSSYRFPDAEPYLQDLFGSSAPDDDQMPDYPVFVSAISATHYLEGRAMINNVNTVARKNFPKSRFFMYDLGLLKTQRNELESICNCEVRTFPFDKFPKHVKIMKGYAWKPLCIQLAAKEHPFVIWMDASVRFKTSDLDQRFDTAKRLGVLASEGYAPVAMRTHPNMFQALGEEACTFRASNEFEATIIMVYANKFVSTYFMKPWVSCALTFGCMVPDHSPKSYINCDAKYGRIYFDCHRFDQSMLSILLNRLYTETIGSHKMKHEFYQFCKSMDEVWFLPNFVNEYLVNNVKECN